MRTMNENKRTALDVQVFYGWLLYALVLSVNHKSANKRKDS